MGGFVKKVKCRCNNRYVIVAIAVFIVFCIILAINLTKGDKEVEYRVLNDADVPQDINSQVIPEYRDLERALACIVDEKIYVVVTRGEKPTSGYELSIDSMEVEKVNGNSNLVVNAKFKDPEPGDSLSQVLTYPLCIAETSLEELPDSIELRVRY